MRNHHSASRVADEATEPAITGVGMAAAPLHPPRDPAAKPLCQTDLGRLLQASVAGSSITSRPRALDWGFQHCQRLFALTEHACENPLDFLCIVLDGTQPFGWQSICTKVCITGKRR